MKTYLLICGLTLLCIASRGFILQKNVITTNTLLSDLNPLQVSIQRPTLATSSTNPNPFDFDGALLPPWSHSFSDSTRKLSFMLIFQQQLDLINKIGMNRVPVDKEMQYKFNDKKGVRVGCYKFHNSMFRQVRMTYFDAGITQVFNTAWFPSYEYDMPIFGCDLLSLGKNKVLAIIDCLPLYTTEEYTNKYVAPMDKVHARHPQLHGSLSKKIYDDGSVFSRNLLLGRFEDEKPIEPFVVPAYSDYINSYLEMIGSVVPNHSPEHIQRTHQRHKEYETYLAKKDPALGLFSAHFGKDWANAFVHDFLFPLSEKE